MTGALEHPRAFLHRHPIVGRFLGKVLKDNLPMLASVVAWSVLSSLVPIVAGLLAITGLVLRHDPSAQSAVVDRLSQGLQGVLSPSDLQDVVRLAVERTGILGILGFFGALWGGANVGGAISTIFQPIFQVRGRDLWQEKLLDVAMIFVFTLLMVIIIIGSTAGALVGSLFRGTAVSGAAVFAIGTAVSLLAALLLFLLIYAVFPNVESRYKVGHIWWGALVAAILFQLLSYVWPLYAHFFRFRRYGAVLAPIVVLGAWIYFFAFILALGAEIVSIGVLDAARRQGESPGPPPDGTVPQRMDVAAGGSVARTVPRDP
ncbi:MAG TPA: YihY/virulence factor BrkB family protein [Chloroflexota bacterium]|nr:YihY/virulence factor BrkB family protein [Chloroflexota bacterium]